MPITSRARDAEGRVIEPMTLAWCREHGITRIDGRGVLSPGRLFGDGLFPSEPAGGRPNFAPGELAVVRLLLRDLRTLRSEARAWLRDPAHQDGAIRASLVEEAADFDDAISGILTTTIYRALRPDSRQAAAPPAMISGSQPKATLRMRSASSAQIRR